MGTAIEVIKALVSPCEKLITAIQAAIGKAYEPRYIRRKADAEAYEIATVGKALRESSDIPIVYDKGALTMDTSDFDEFKKRTQSRLAYQELSKQKNIESVTDFAYEQLVGEPDVPDEPVDADWMNRFFNSVAEVSNEQMQRIWAKLLAGEIKQPNTFSIRTLDTLKNLTAYEADLFRSICPLVMRCPGNRDKSIEDYFILSDYFDENCPVEYYVLQVLEDAGLLSINNFISIGFILSPGDIEYIKGVKSAIKATNTGSSPAQISHLAFFLTTAGKELFSLISSDCIPPEDYYGRVIELLKRGNQLEAFPEMIQLEVVDLLNE